MCSSVQSSLCLKLTPIPLASLKDSKFCLSELFQKFFCQTYLKPFDRDPLLVLKEKEFEILDANISRVTHVAMHAARETKHNSRAQRY
jgi:hypothetical protein